MNYARPLHIICALFLLLCSSTAFAAPPVDFTDLVKKAGPAVVNISTEKTEEVRSSRRFAPFGPFGQDPFFEEFFNQFNPHNQGQRPSRKRSSLGSGFIISADGYIVTNNHVVEGADVIRVTMQDGTKEKSYSGNVIGTDPDTDLALLKVEASDLPFLAFGDSDVLEVGSWVVAIGNPLGLDHTVTAGILSAKGRNIQSGSYDDYLQTDASINPGNSGGPLLNMEGKVIGINTAIAQRAQGIGFAIPSSMAEKIINSLKEHRKVNRGWLGVSIQNIDEATQKALGMKDTNGALIGNVMEGQPADNAGIKAGDVILKINGKAIADADQLTREVANIKPGSKIETVIWREGKEQTLVVTLAERESPQSLSADANTPEEDNASSRLGIAVRTVTATDANRMQLAKTQGLLVTGVNADGLAGKSGLHQGDVILAVNKKVVNTPDELRKAVNESSKKNTALLLHVARKESVFFIAIDLAEKADK